MSGKRGSVVVVVLVVASFLAGIIVGNSIDFPVRELRSLKRVVFDVPNPRKQIAVDDSFSPYYERRMEHFRVHGQRAKIVMVGDSITDQAEWQELLPEYSIANRGISGDTVNGVKNRLTSISTTEPRIAFVMIGINDFRRGVDAETVLTTYKEIIDGLLDSEVTVLVQSTLLTGPKWAELNHSVRALNEGLVDFTTMRGIAFIDLNSVLSDGEFLKPEFTNDDIHLNARAYGIWRSIIIENLESLGISPRQ